MDKIARQKVLQSLVEGRLTLSEAETQLDALERAEERPPIQIFTSWRDVWDRSGWQRRILWGVGLVFLLPLALVVLMIPAVLLMGLIVGGVALVLALPAYLVMLIWNGLGGMIPIPAIEFWQALLLVFLFTLLMRLMRR